MLGRTGEGVSEEERRGTPVFTGSEGPAGDRFTRGRFGRVLIKMKAGKAVPEGCLPKEVWQQVMRADSSEGDFLMRVMNPMFSAGVVPRGFQTGETVQLGKFNGEEGTARVRLINKLGPVGKAMVNYVYDEGPTQYYDLNIVLQVQEEGAAYLDPSGR